MISIILSLALAAAPAPAPSADQHKDHAQHSDAKHECKMECCKGDKPMPCCEKMKAGKSADAPAPAADAHGGHAHDH